MCAKIAHCSNAQDAAEQERPVLSGNQSFVDANGACTYGHAGAGRECLTDQNCGVVYRECECVSQDRARSDQTGRKAMNITIGVVIFVAGMAVLCAVLRWRRRGRRGGDRVRPFGASAGGVADPTIFQGICAPPGRLPPTVVGRPCDLDLTPPPPPPQAAGRCGCGFNCLLTWFATVILPIAAMVCGAALFAKGVVIEVDGYYNQCLG